MTATEKTIEELFSETSIFTWLGIELYSGISRGTVKRLTIYNDFPKPQLVRYGRRRLAVFPRLAVDEWLDKNELPTCVRYGWGTVECRR
jgi:predicted DNA-binding transcriptional regulator AlpA